MTANSVQNSLYKDIEHNPLRLERETSSYGRGAVRCASLVFEIIILSGLVWNIGGIGQPRLGWKYSTTGSTFIQSVRIRAVSKRIRVHRHILTINDETQYHSTPTHTHRRTRASGHTDRSFSKLDAMSLVRFTVRMHVRMTNREIRKKSAQRRWFKGNAFLCKISNISKCGVYRRLHSIFSGLDGA